MNRKLSTCSHTETTPRESETCRGRTVRAARVTLGLLVSTLLLLSLYSCASPMTPPLAEVLARVEAAESAVPFRIAVAPVSVTDDVARRPKAGSHGWSPVPLDLHGLRANTIQAIHASGRFRRADVLELATDTGEGPQLSAPDEGSGLAFAVPKGLGETELLECAFDRRADAVLQLAVRTHRVLHEGWASDSVRFWELFLDLNLLFPQWWIYNELYRADVEVEARLLAVGTGREVWRRIYCTDGLPPKKLSPLDRRLAWYWFDSFVTPRKHDLENWVSAGQHTLPVAWNHIFVSLARDLSSESFVDDISRLSKTLVLAVGVGQQRSGIPDLDTPNKDAAQFSRALRELGEVPAAHVVELTGSRATRQAILASLRELVARMNEADSLLIYYSGYGLARHRQLALVPYDYQPDEVDSRAIPLETLRSLLDGAPGRHAILLDTSFGSERPGTRTLGDGRAPGSKLGKGEAPMPLSTDIERLAKGRSVLLAARIDEAVDRASVDPEDKSGLFTARLLHALRQRELDVDENGWVDLTEAFEQARIDTEELASLSGFSQHPTSYGEPARVPVARVREAVRP